MYTVPPDKANHVIAGGMAAVLAMCLAWLAGWAAYGGAAALGAAIVVGLWKEARDAWRNRQLRAQGLPAAHGVELLDWLATVAGGMAAYVAFCAGAAS